MNKIAIALILAIPALTIIFSTGGCKKDNSPTVTEYTIPIDSIQHADTITEGDDLAIKFYGKVGTTSCEDFGRFDVSFEQTVIDITTVGIKTDNGNCTPEVKYMNGSTLTISSVPAGNITIRVEQPSGNPLESAVVVKKKG
ncbi:MAG: hypothetical protein GXO86_15640 [Chlorobi bacterium]|nr:hypothetical protein [Chlorobiota bacterium]